MTFDAERDQGLRSGMADEQIDAVLAWRTEEIVVTTGECPHWGMTLCLYPRMGTPVMYTLNLEPAELLPSHMTVRLYADGDDLGRMLNADLAALSLHRVGYSVETGRHALPGNAAEIPPYPTSLIASLLGDVGVTSDFFAAQLMRKTAHDVDHLMLTHQIAAYGLRAFFDALQSGRTEAEIAGAIELAIQAQTGKHGCKLARGWAFVQAGVNTIYAGSASRSSGYALQQGDLVVLEMATMVDGYWSDLTRTAVVGTPTDQQSSLIDAVRAAQRAALDTVGAGVTHEAVDAAARAVMDERGFGQGFTHATGHHVGFRYHDYGPGLAARSNTPLQAGNVITVEPGAYGAQFGGGCRFEDNVLVTEDGFRFLSPHELLARSV